MPSPQNTECDVLDRNSCLCRTHSLHNEMYLIWFLRIKDTPVRELRIQFVHLTVKKYYIWLKSHLLLIIVLALSPIVPSFLHPSIYPYIHPSIYLSLHPCLHPSIHRSINLFSIYCSSTINVLYSPGFARWLWYFSSEVLHRKNFTQNIKTWWTLGLPQTVITDVCIASEPGANYELSTCQPCEIGSIIIIVIIIPIYRWVHGKTERSSALAVVT